VVSEQDKIMRVKILVTGGTFDKEYNELKGELFFKESHLPEMLRLGRCKLRVDIRTLMMVDSLSMTDADRKNILETCKEIKEDKILITHGTDTMVETAKVLGNAIKNKTIILTGAMVPYKFGSSDGLFNLGSSLAFVQALPDGVYISMNGKCFHWDNVRKNKKIGEFEEIKQPIP
jgi:L-asparaginase